ncbi:PucR family transcriptional regulator ligand-binding domain-containing protein [Arthrobacter sp. SDTb3-6]|uniref:PucR family transcriptional regulator n=1 Tax=Arthrobacter sp. SDTb3-6 TaxID=2713571 RepID=UPI00159DA0B0|nr:PucR family transcriptional regulator ligand-binding domain-containing protein [Arthrobacter sp. SDTb3-6]NVN00476.1 PucR family transcriptional regulator [Arthrobacter sp. SDTb3-6]
MITLAEVLASQSMSAAGPELCSNIPGTLQRVVRWVHSSEVLEIAPLLRGGELLLSGGEGLLALPDDQQRDYVRSLAGRNIAALALQTAGRDAPLPDGLIAAANESGLPLIELHAVAPFVDIAESVNRRVVNEQADAHLVVDDVSRRIARHITDRGPHLPTILGMVASALGVEVSLAAADGLPLGQAGSVEGGEGSTAVAGIVVGGQLAAQLTLRSPSEDSLVLELAADRLSGIFALALAQSFRPTPAQVAEARLLESVMEGGDGGSVRLLWQQAGLRPEQAAVMAVFRTSGREANFTAVERALRAGGVNAKSHLRDGELAVLFALAPNTARAAREALIAAAREAVRGADVCAAFGPGVAAGFRAHESYVEAREVLRLGAPAGGQVLDAMEFLGRRILGAVHGQAFMDPYVRSSMGELLAWDRKHGTELLKTLVCWLDSGCNTTGSAATLNIERQTMHKRLNKIAELLGGDPRTSGRLFDIHIAAKAAANGVPGGRAAGGPA